MNKEQQQIIDEVYEEYLKNWWEPKPEEPLVTMDSLHQFLQSLINSQIGLRRKVVLLQKYVDSITKKK